MAHNYHSLIPEIKKRMKEEFLRETPTDTDEFLGLPYPYTVSAKEKRNALFYWDTYFVNIGLVKMKLVDQARHQVENLIFLQRRFGYIPASNRKDMITYSNPPMLPWMVRDIYRATGDKEWLRRMLPDVEKEYNFWTGKKHTSPSGLFRYMTESNGGDTTISQVQESGWDGSPRFPSACNLNPVDLNALLYRNAKLIYDLQVEAHGEGDSRLMSKAGQIQRLIKMCWHDNEGFYLDNDIDNKRLSLVKSLAGFMPMFVEMIDSDQARTLQRCLKLFAGPGGLACTDQDYGLPNAEWNYPLCYAPYMYFTLKGLVDYEIMEDAADIGTAWLDTVVDNYEKTGEFWLWYNARDRSTKHPHGIENIPVMGWTAGAYIALADALGLE